MNISEKLVLEAELFSAVGRIWPGERNPLSPLPDYTIESLNKKIIRLLQKRNLISPEGQVNPEIKPYFDGLLQPDHFFEISLFEEKKSANYSVFFNLDSTSAIFLHSSPPTIEISKNSMHNLFLEEIRTYLPGKTTQLSDDNEIALPLDYAWLFAAIFDLHLQKQSKILNSKKSKGSASVFGVINPAKIKTALKQFSDSRDWVLLSFISILTGDLPDTDLNIDSGLGWLEKKNLINRNKQGCILANEYKDLVEQITPIISLINLHTVNQKSALQISSQKMACVTSERALFIAAYRENEDLIHFKSLNPNSFLTAIDQLLQKPKLLFPVFGFEIEESSSINCPVCSQKQSQEKLNCINCGLSFSDSVPNKDSWPIPRNESSKNLIKPRLIRFTRKSDSSSVVNNPDEISVRRERLPWWLFLLIFLVLIVILCFTFTTLNPITIRIK